MKGNKLNSIMFNKCPRCQEGDFYNIKNPYKAFFKKDVMLKECSVCGQPYEPETGFYYGAMFVSYAINVMAFVIVWAFIQLLFPSDFSILSTVIIIAITLVAIAPISLYYSRLIWIAFFVKYKRG